MVSSVNRSGAVSQEIIEGELSANAEEFSADAASEAIEGSEETKRLQKLQKAMMKEARAAQLLSQTVANMHSNQRNILQNMRV